MRSALLAAAVFATIASPALADDLALACSGQGTYQDASGTTATFHNYRTGQSTSAFGTTTGQGVTAAAVGFELTAAGARIRMPPVMTPPINVGSDAGWWTVDRLNVTPTEITGRFTLNLFNKPSIRIDRVRGSIEVDGNFDYYFLGDCERIEMPTTPRF